MSKKLTIELNNELYELVKDTAKVEKMSINETIGALLETAVMVIAMAGAKISKKPKGEA